MEILNLFWFLLLFVGFGTNFKKIGQQNIHGFSKTMNEMVYSTKFDVYSILK